MPHDEIYMNIETGEILPAEQAIHQFYTVEKHGALDAWTDEWIPTGEYAESFLDAPDFHNF